MSTRLVPLAAAGVMLLGAGCETQFMMAPAANLGAGTGATVPAPVPVSSTTPSATNTAGTIAAPAPIGTGTAGVAATGPESAGSPASMTAPNAAGAGPGPSEFGGTAAPMPAAGSSAGAAGDSASTMPPLPMAGVPAEAGTGAPAAGSGGDVTPPVAQTCPAAGTLRPGETTESVQVGSITRRYILHVPASYDGTKPVPLILDWHGILLSSSIHRTISGFAELSDREGFIVAFPEGTDTAWNIGKCCTSSRSVDDLGFAKAIVTKLSQQGCIDLKRVHSTGYSMGGGMTMFLACNATDVFASIATSAFDLQPEEDEPCHPSRPISVIDFRSTADPIVAYPGAKDTVPPNGTPTLVTFIGAQNTAMKWATLDGCMSSPQMGANGCVTYSPCNADTEVVLCTTQGGGHDLMDPASAWAFLKRHPMP